VVDIADQLYSKLKDARPFDLDLGPEIIYPAYDGLSLLNLPASLCRWLGAPNLHHPPLAIAELDGLASDIRQIIVVLIDAISLQRFRIWIDGLAKEFDLNRAESLFATITSTVPSTTSTALTTIWTASSPAEHGILGYELFLKEYGLIANMITHSPIPFETRAGLLYQAGFRPEDALPVAAIGPHLDSAGVETFAFLPNTIHNSGLSRMHYPAVSTYGFRTPSDLWIHVRELAEIPLDIPRLIWIYFGMIDTLSHHYGPDSEQVEAEFVTFMRTMSEIFLNHFRSSSRQETLLLITSDHGQLSTPKDPKYELIRHPLFVHRLHMYPTGESRFAYLYPRPGQMKALEQYIQEAWPGSFHLLPSVQALKKGLFGPGCPAKETLDRIGDWIAIALGNAYLWWAPKPNPLLGRHGGLSEDEMLVPLLAIHLG
jgi:hypothetical protein